MVWKAISTLLVTATAEAYSTPPVRPRAAVRGSVIMKNTKMSTSGDNASVVQYCIPDTGPRFHRAVIEWPATASAPMSAAKTTQNTVETASRCSRLVMTRPPTRMIP